MKTAKVLYGKFSQESGNTVRHVYDASGNLVGLIRKLEGGGYRVYRQKDGKSRDKDTLEQAFKTIRRAT